MLGLRVGESVGSLLGENDGLSLGDMEGIDDGFDEMDGMLLGLVDGRAVDVGLTVGVSVL